MNAPAVTLQGSATAGGRPLFGPLELALVPGGWTCLLGASGCGKSTLLRLVAGLDTGVVFQGEIRAEDGLKIPPRCAYMAQDDLLLPWLDVLGNVTLGARLRGDTPDSDRAEALIDRLGLTEHAAKRPSALSGGQRQRVALARTLMENRAIVLLDEPFSALDARTRAEMQELAAETLEGRTVLMVTHEPAEAARLAHRICLMTEGRIASPPPPPGSPIRPADDAETLAAQARLLGLLRAA